jgi:DNA (cytosine-5)-methyltransferase 1
MMASLSRLQKLKPQLSEKAPTGIVLFAGGGGIECGLIEAGIRPVASAESDPENRKLSEKFADSQEQNFSEYGHLLIQKSVQECAASNWAGFPDYADFFHASLVCANFSNMKTDGVEEESDLTAATATADGIDHFKSWCFTLENVAAYQDSESWNHIIRPALKDYSLWSGVLNCADYGVPQNRKRFIVIAVREADFPVIPPPTWDSQFGWFDVIAPWWEELPQATLTEAQSKAIEGKQGIYLIPRLGYRGELPPTIEADKPAPTIKKSLFLDDKGATRNNWLNIWSDGEVRHLTIPALGYGLQTFPEWYEFPESVGTAGAIIGYSVPPLFYKQIVELVLPLLNNPHKGKEIHPLCELLPPMQPEELTDLYQDIKEHGLLEPIWLYEGKILDGRSRYQACLLAGVEPKFITWQGDHGTPLEFVVAKNLKRRHLTASQRAVVALDVLPHLEEEAKKRSLLNLKQRAGSSEVAKLPPRSDKVTKKSRTQAAQTVGASPRYVSDAKRISEESPELLPEIRSGKKTISQAIQEIKRRDKPKKVVPLTVGGLVRVGKQVGRVLELNADICTVQIWQDIQEFEIDNITPADAQIQTSISQEDYLFLLSLNISSLHEAIEMLKASRREE